MAKLNLYKISRTSYDKLVEDSNINAQTIYWLDDGTICVGGQTYGGQVVFITEDPINPEMNTIYINKSNLSAKIYNGIGFESITKGYTVEMSDDGTDNVVPTEKAVANYVAQKIASLPTAVGVTNIESAGNGKLSITKNGITSDVTMNGTVYSPIWDSANYKLTLPIAGSTALEINFAKDSVVRGGKYNADTQEIWLTTAEDGSYADEDYVIKIPATDLIDIYTGKATSTATTTVSSDNDISVDIKISSESNNAIQTKEDGLYVPSIDISDKMDTIKTTNPDEVVITNANGNVKSSGKKIGGDTISGVPDANTLATEVAVQKATKSIAATTLESAKTYADSVASTAQANAKTYTDSIITWENW